MLTLAKLLPVMLLLRLVGVSLGYADKQLLIRLKRWLVQCQPLMDVSTCERVFFDTWMASRKTHWNKHYVQ